jgi:plastocyanin
MNRTVVIIIGAILAIALGVLVAWLLVASTRTANQPSTGTTSPAPQGSPSDNVPIDPNAANPGDSKTASVLIENSAFTPAKLTIKKGTTVTWTNNDNIGHNVVSDDDAPAGGPPKTADVFGQGEVFSFTYDSVGIFPYHCAPHPFMQGAVEVVE